MTSAWCRRMDGTAVARDRSFGPVFCIGSGIARGSAVSAVVSRVSCGMYHSGLGGGAGGGVFASFSQHKIPNRGAVINFRRAGDGPPLLLLHGHPQPHVLWHEMAPALARRLTVVAPALLGYGDSSKPATDPEHAAYSKRAMAADMVHVIAELVFRRFAVAGHDRGGRVAYRMALDHPEIVSKLAVLDIVTTHTMWTKMDKALATASYHWLFLMQPDRLPETLICKTPRYYLPAPLLRWA